MRVILQRVTEASVTVDGTIIGQIGRGLLVLAGFDARDNAATLAAMAEKIIALRIFDDADGRMNLSLADIGGEILCVSQFTLFADCRKGRRPSYTSAAPPDAARQLYNDFILALRQRTERVETGEFQAMMEVRLLNWGPVTIALDSEELGHLPRP